MTYYIIIAHIIIIAFSKGTKPATASTLERLLGVDVYVVDCYIILQVQLINYTVPTEMVSMIKNHVQHNNAVKKERLNLGFYNNEENRVTRTRQHHGSHMNPSGPLK